MLKWQPRWCHFIDTALLCLGLIYLLPYLRSAVSSYVLGQTVTDLEL